MRIRNRRLACVAIWGLCGWCFPAFGQESPHPTEVIPAPPAAPGGTPRTYRPDAKYGPLAAGQDAYQAAEAERRWAINRQLGIIDSARWYNAWSPYVRPYGLYPYCPWLRQPIGHEEIWTGPNSYIYHPRRTAPEVAPDAPTPAAPATPPAPTPIIPAPEKVPAPPAESGPREF